MGTVYSAEHLSLRKKVAIKALHLDLLRLPNIAARFEREARATARIEHPNVTLALDFGTLPSGALYLVLEFVEGRRLREEIAPGPMPVLRALHIARQISSLLEAAQSLGIVHRDLKPENVLLVQRGDDPDFVKVLDFGIARVTAGDDEPENAQPLTKLGAVFGTPEYMAPEQALGQRVDSRADLYSLGVMLFEMLAGTRPYVQTGQTGILSQQITAPRPTFAERAPSVSVPQEVERVVFRLLSKGAAERYQRASDVTSVLDAILANREPKPLTSSIPPDNSVPLPSFDLNTKVPGLLTEPEAPVGPSRSRGMRLKAQLSAYWGVLLPRLAQVNSIFTSHLDRLIAVVRSQLPPKVQQSMVGLSQRWLRGLAVAVGALALLIPVLVIAIVVRVSLGHHAAKAVTLSAPSVTAAPTAAPTPSVSLVPTPLDENSKDPDVLLALAVQRLVANKDTEALGFVMRALGRQPERRNDDRLAHVLFRTANSPQKDVADKTFALLQGILGAKGSEIIYQLWIDKSVRDSTRKRAEKWLRSEPFERTASGATYVAARLRMADSCEKKLALLATAGKIGNSTTLAYLEELDHAAGCGLDGKLDCYPCLRQGAVLTNTIAQIRTRTDAKP